MRQANVGMGTNWTAMGHKMWQGRW